MTGPTDVVADLLAVAGLDPAASDRLGVTGPAEVLPSVYPVTTAASASVGAALVAAALLTDAGDVGLDTRHVAAAFRSERHLAVDGRPPADPWDPIAGHYPVADGGWVQLHTNFPHHRRAAVVSLGLPPDATRDEVAAELAGWDAQDVEDVVNAAAGCASRMRTRGEWLAHPQAAAIADLPVLEVERVGDAPLEEPRPGGIRVLDLTRVIAGPVAGRFLAAIGADVLAVTAAHLPQVTSILPDANVGKRSTFLDLREPEGYEAMQRLVAGADVVIGSYRPGALAGLGFGWDDLVRMRPGLVVVELSAYGGVGPWGGRRGFDSLVQTATGICDEGRRAAGADRPVPLPCQALDHATGYLAAFGALAALQRRCTEGGSWRARVALARTGCWLDGLGRLEAGLSIRDPAAAEVAPYLVDLAAASGAVTLVQPPGSIDGRPLAWPNPPPVLGSDQPTW